MALKQPPAVASEPTPPFSVRSETLGLHLRFSYQLGAFQNSCRFLSRLLGRYCFRSVSKDPPWSRKNIFLTTDPATALMIPGSSLVLGATFHRRACVCVKRAAPGYTYM